MGWLGARTGSLGCWWTRGTPVLADALQRGQPCPSIPQTAVDMTSGLAPGQVPVTLGGCRAITEMASVVGRISPTAGCCHGCEATVTGMGWGSAGAVPPQCYHPGSLLAFHK